MYFILLYNNKDIYNIESYTNKDDENKDDENKKGTKKTIDSYLNKNVPDIVAKYIDTIASLTIGPKGDRGDNGLPGAKYLARGRLVNQSHCEDQCTMSLSRTSDLHNSGSVLTEKIGIRPQQTWVYRDDYTIKNNFDNNCIVSQGKNKQVKIGNCKISNNNQWVYKPHDNRIYLKNVNDNQLCLSLGKSVGKIPECTGKKCLNLGPVQYAYLTECNNNIKTNEIWNFI